MQQKSPAQPARAVLFGVQLWQIFTALTLIITIGSGLIYVKNIVPQTKNQEFIALTKMKTTLYNQNEYIKTYFENNYNKNLVGFQLTQGCYADIKNASQDNKSLEANLYELNEQQRYTNALQTEYTQKNIHSEQSQLLTEYSAKVQEYLTQVTLMFQKQQIYQSSTYTILKAASDICASDISSLPEKISTFRTLIDEFPLNSLETMSEWVEISKKLAETADSLATRIASPDYTPQAIATLIETFRNDYIALFSVAFNYDVYKNKVSSAYADSIDSLRNVEEYEQSYIAQNKIVEGNTVFVTIKDE